MAKRYCSNCKSELVYQRNLFLRAGQAHQLIGKEVMASGLSVDVYTCPQCGKIEFYAPQDQYRSDDDLPQVTCPKCGTTHDFDYGRCPVCGFEY